MHAEKRNSKLKHIIEQLQQETDSNKHYLLVQELNNHSDETELDIEQVKNCCHETPGRKLHSLLNKTYIEIRYENDYTIT